MKWKVRDGRMLEISDMSTTHICNAICYLERNADQRFLVNIIFGENPFWMSNRAWLRRHVPEYKALVAERKKRAIRTAGDSIESWFPD